MRYLLTATSIVLPAYLYALLPSITITYTNTILIALVSLLSASVLVASVALTRKGY